MRKCLRCGAEMKENCDLRVQGAGYGVVLSTDESKLFGGRIGKPKVAVCPQCGEISLYLDDVGETALKARGAGRGKLHAQTLAADRGGAGGGSFVCRAVRAGHHRGHAAAAGSCACRRADERGRVRGSP